MKHKRLTGFTVVELLVVIVVIAVLAAITIVSYDSLTKDAVTTQRVSDINTIAKALEAYYIKKGGYPPSGDTFVDSRSGTFLPALEPYLGTKTPIDPENSSTSYYRYMRWEANEAGYGSCTREMGKFYLLEIVTPTADSRLIAKSPTTGCAGSPQSLYGGGYISYTMSSHEK